ncbi:hypothetical protein QFC21_005991 [Naganishia friedmannii]|uniref:Uncharacterized protein n=1 Tax=Naganishia friedmannii TaxID=89922 RepID=A0ACC2V622_9TREE|nr:hypothetical protein QFC21_005991 [Naganishia friedmannii]
MFLPPHQPIRRLPHGVPELIHATTVLPTYSSFLAELVNNAIDANASYISCWINPPSWSMRVTDDGEGIPQEDLKGGLGSLASMGTLATLEIISCRQGFATTYHETIKNGKPLSLLRSERHAKSSSGTTIILKDIYHSVRMKRTVGSKSATSTIQACKKALELAVLNYASHPSRKPSSLAITLTLEDNPLSGTSSKRLLDIKLNTSDILQTFAALFGAALTESSKSFRASSHGIQVRGFISFTGHPTRAHQYVFVKGCCMEQSELVEVVEGIYKRYGVLVSEEDEEGRHGAARGEGGKGAQRSMKPVFLLHLIVPASETDAGLGPLNDIQSVKNNDLVRKVVSSTLKNILKSHAPKLVRSETAPPTTLIPDSMAGSLIGHTGSGFATPRQTTQTDAALDCRPAVSSYAPTSFVDSPLGAAGHPSRSAGFEQEIGQTPEWLTRALANRAQQVFPKPVSSNLPTLRRSTCKSKADAQEEYGRADTSLDQVGMACVQFSKQDLAHATFLSQIDNKFICCLVIHQDGRKTLVMIDQHAADERVRVERFLQETLQEFRTTQVTSTALGVLAHVIQLPSEQVDWLMARSERLALFTKWGFQMCPTTELFTKTASYSSITVDSVPTLLLNRLGATGGKEVKDIIAGYIAFLQTQPHESIAALAENARDSAHCPGLDVDGLLRWMPKRMKELVDSKACRGAIMFNDPLSVDKCKLLIKQLSRTSFPFICAHGRPSIFPIGQMPSIPARTGNIHGPCNDAIKWTTGLLG